MKSGKANAIWVGVAAFVAIVCLAGGSVIISTFATGVSKKVAERKEQNQANSAMEQSLRNVIDGKQLGPKPKFPATTVGKMQEDAYAFLEKQVARQKTFTDELAASKFDWVMTPDSLRSEKNLDESLKRLAKARELADWFYGGMESDLKEATAELKRIAGNDREALEYVAEFEKNSMGRNGGFQINREVAMALKRNHDALEGCIKTLKKQIGKYTVSKDGSITFKAEVPDSAIAEYNRFVEETTKSMDEINTLETKRVQLVNQALAKMPK